MVLGSKTFEELSEICKNIKLQNILDAFDYIDKNGVPPRRNPRTRYLEYKGKKYPTKYSFELAHNKFSSSNIKLDDSDYKVWDAERLIRKYVPEPIPFKIVNLEKDDRTEIKTSSKIEELLEICKDLTEEHIIQACEAEPEMLSQKGKADSYFIEYNNKLFNLNPTIRFANNNIIDNKIKLLPEDFNSVYYYDFFKLKFENSKKLKCIHKKEAFMENNNKQHKKQTNQKKYWIYQPGKQGRLWNDVYANDIIAIGWEELGDLKQYNSKDALAQRITEIYSKKNYPMNDTLANWEFANVMDIGDIVYVKKGVDEYLIGRGIVQSDYYFDDTRKEYKSVKKIKWTHKGIYNVDFSQLNIKQWNQKTLTDISEDKYKDFCLKIEDIFMNNSPRNNIIPFNQILYGPPGTGKTYNTVVEAMKITGIPEESSAEYDEDEYETYNSVVKKLKDKNSQTEFNNSEYKILKKEFDKLSKSDSNPTIDEYIDWYRDNKFRPNKENPKTDTIQSYRLELKKWAKQGFNLLEVTNKDELNKFIEDINNEMDNQGIKGREWITTLTKEENYLEFNNNYKRGKSQIAFITFHQSYSYEEFVEGIKPDLEDNSKLNYKREEGIFKKICDRAKDDSDNDYVLIIDEINRGNISKIFGELITLIEEDKRENLTVTLPYSQEPFTVPKNLYIIGTMNTSDRSIASVDIALRRRFKFKEMMPKSDLVADFGDINFSKKFEQMNKKISILLDRDHQIGHSYFIKEKYENAEISELKEIWYDSILPLLNEYFYGDWEKLQAVLGKAKDKGDDTFIRSFKPEDCGLDKNYCDEEQYYEFVPYKEINFEAALKNAFGN